MRLRSSFDTKRKSMARSYRFDMNSGIPTKLDEGQTFTDRKRDNLNEAENTNKYVKRYAM